ncbi:MAG: cytochrome d ubiquinol oxidase subunit II [Thermoanaerobaculia bacterium]
MLDLQTTWFLLIGVLLIGYAVLDGFDLGVGMLHLFIAKDDRERRILLNSVGPVWDGNEVWLLTGGGAIFAAFPKVYATVFSGFYLALMLLLLALMFRAVSLEFRGKEESSVWRSFWDSAFAIGSFLPALLFGVALGNILRGVPLAADQEFAGTFLGLLNPFALMVGVLSVLLFLIHGASWLVLKTEGDLQRRAANVARFSWLLFVAAWVLTTVAARFFAPHLWQMYHHAVAWIVPTLFVASTLGFMFTLRRGRRGLQFLFSSVSIAMLLGIVGQGLYPNMVPALGDAERSLTIYNASSTHGTLQVMLAIALIGMPIVLAYTIFIYRSFRGPVVLDEQSY